MAHLLAGLSGLRQLLVELRIGPLFSSRPEGGGASPQYLNTAAVGRCRLAPEDLLAELKRLELRRGRRLAARNAARPLDLDLLLFGDLEISRAELTIPHPRLTQRPFALIPLAAVAPHWKVPPSGASVAELAVVLDGDAGLRPLPWPEGVIEGRRLMEPDC